jgi:hypothetical protein
VKLSICDDQDANASAPNVVVTAANLTKKDSTASPYPATDAGNANPDSNFRDDSSQGSYIYNLATKSLTTGTWALTFTITGDPVAHAVQVDLR